MADADDSDGGQDERPRIDHGAQCRKVSGVAVRVLLDLLRELAVDGKVALADAERVAEAVLGSEGPIATVYRNTGLGCEAAFSRVAIERQRHDALGRLIAEPLEPLLDVPTGIERRRLGQLFLAIRMMLGEEEYEALRVRAAEMAKRHREAGMVDWPAFHGDPEAALVREHVLVGIARSFKRFDARRDWFLVVLNATPSAVSLGSTAFTPLPPEERAKLAFTEGHMARVLDALFAALRIDTFDSTRLREFSKRWNMAPEKMLNPFFLELARLAMQAK
ncbi:hypothetical protein [Magnetospirillum sp. UT-4]|uniref:hypothetical protein n=1 Tax=Magnetospirillum sp. UT-4 TaxID=2681467 RepID=UPI001385B27B|nr:hypothetical protein [Magnetospirillum sp. UT-4]CAA7618341.1 conserved hypothetical protein [Magnetospirillum sp. UT-4]